MFLFLLLFIGIPLIELYFLIQVGSQIGALSTIGLSIFTALLGGVLVRIQGFSVLMRVRDAMGRNQVPALELLDGALLLVAGLVLLLPGFFTDTLGFLLLVPKLRRFLILRFFRILPDEPSLDQGPDRPGPRVIEGEFRRERD
ncbi:FxsA family protein [Candidatus Thiosymbion oneisti]|uniref:FxsA family protein n=1 Tax=Candidatus Thiosymbion oneisti TaxID=589554 RepID=UPI000B7F13A2|nr:FxsA family protein [Candidatus Thiosymbion oneisti]